MCHRRYNYWKGGRHHLQNHSPANHKLAIKSAELLVCSSNWKYWPLLKEHQVGDITVYSPSDVFRDRVRTLKTRRWMMAFEGTSWANTGWHAKAHNLSSLLNWWILLNNCCITGDKPATSCQYFSLTVWFKCIRLPWSCGSEPGTSYVGLIISWP